MWTAGSAGRQSTANIEIRPKENGRGIEVYVRPGTKGESVHIPVVVDESGLQDLVYNEFYIGEGADVDIVAAAASTTTAGISPSTTGSTPSMWGKTPGCGMWKSMSAKGTAAANGMLNR